MYIDELHIGIVYIDELHRYDSIDELHPRRDPS
jgi:hypothetical protein